MKQCIVFDWQLLSPVSAPRGWFASWWVWTQSQTFQRINKLQTRYPTTDFSRILTSQSCHKVLRRKNTVFLKTEGKNDYKYQNTLSVTLKKNIYSLYIYIRGNILDEESSGMVSYDSDPQTGNIWTCFRLFSWGVQLLSCRLQTKQGKASFFSLLRDWNIGCKCDSRWRLQLSPLIWSEFLCSYNSDPPPLQPMEKNCRLWTFPDFRTPRAQSSRTQSSFINT